MNARKKILNANMLLRMPVMDRPPNLGGVVEQLSIRELQRRLNIVYDESLYMVPGLDIDELNSNNHYFPVRDKVNKEIKNLLIKPDKYLQLAKMENFGHAVFASVNIPADTIVAVYAGTITSKQAKLVMTDEALGFAHSEIRVTCRESRGIASFMQHLPTKPCATVQEHVRMLNDIPGNNVTEDLIKRDIELFNIKFDDEETKKSVATQNVAQVPLIYNGYPIIVFVSERLIKKGELVGFSYGYKYWFMRDLFPAYFDKDGKQISTQKYKRTYGPIDMDTFTIFSEYKPIIEQMKTSPTVIFNKSDKQTIEVPSSVVALKLIQSNAVKLQDLNVYPLELRIVADDKTILHTLIDLTEAQQQNLYGLRQTEGKDVIRQLSFQPVYEISNAWLQEFSKKERAAYFVELFGSKLSSVFGADLPMRSVLSL